MGSPRSRCTRRSPARNNPERHAAQRCNVVGPNRFGELRIVWRVALALADRRRRRPGRWDGTVGRWGLQQSLQVGDDLQRVRAMWLRELLEPWPHAQLQMLACGPSAAVAEEPVD